MKRFIFSFFAFCFLTLMTLGVSAAVFQDGQKVCFYGDSITHGGRFHYMIYDYYLTRFPDANITFLNAGVAGDNAGAAMNRIEEDVFAKNPDVVVLMFGMNDVNRGQYVENPSESQLASQRYAIERYEKNMQKLARTLQERLNPTFMFITPSPFDHTGVNDRNNNNPGCNDGLGKCAEIVKRLAGEMAKNKDTGTVNVVDFHAPMTAFNAKMQANDPRYTIVGPDRVHPQAQGHLMMAWLFLKTQGAPALVSDVVLNAEADAEKSATVERAENATVSELKKDANGKISCTILEKALPFPMDAEAYPVLKELPIVEELNQETFAVKSLSAGNYELKIDGNAVGTYTAEELAQGVNLAMNPKTPQFQQAENVRKLGLQRRGTEVKLRDHAAVRWFLRLRQVNPDDMVAVQKIYDEKFSKTGGYFEDKTPGYLKNWGNRAEVQEKLAQETEELLKLRKPVAHMYEIVPIK